MNEIVLAEQDARSLRNALLRDVESCAVLLANSTEGAIGKRLLISDLILAGTSDYLRRSDLEAQLSPDFVARITKIALRSAKSIIFVHSHPGTAAPSFSSIDDEGERKLALFLGHRHPNASHGSIVLSEGGWSARELGTNKLVRLTSVGESLAILFDPANEVASDFARFDRQIRALGPVGQRAAERLSVAIVGLGGTGSLVAQQLVHLGVRKFTLIDADVIEVTNLNRLVNATVDSIGAPKVKVAAEYIQAVAPDAIIKVVEGDVTRASVACQLTGTDLIFGCTDSHGSRAVMQQIAYQYFIPYIDLGVTIVVSNDKISHIVGRVQLLAPGLACFACSNLLDGNEVRRDLMSEFERQSDPYITGFREPAPAVISFNGTTSSLACTMFLSVVAGIPSAARHLLYNARNSTLRNVRADQNPDCFVCSKTGFLAKGDTQPLIARQDNR